MENASKALIIAGSILLSILIIAFGMYIFSSSSSVTDDSTLSGMEVSTFNGKFERYKGQQNGTNVGALVDALISNARTNDSVSERPIVYYNFDENGETTGTIEINPTNTETNYVEALKDLKDVLQSSHRYFTGMETDDDTDLIHQIEIRYTRGTNSLFPTT